jgi:hypothetical protein
MPATWVGRSSSRGDAANYKDLQHLILDRAALLTLGYYKYYIQDDNVGLVLVVTHSASIVLYCYY